MITRTERFPSRSRNLSSLPALPQDPLELLVHVLVVVAVGVVVLGVLDQGQGLQVHGATLKESKIKLRSDFYLKQKKIK